MELLRKNVFGYSSVGSLLCTGKRVPQAKVDAYIAQALECLGVGPTEPIPRAGQRGDGWRVPHTFVVTTVKEVRAGDENDWWSPFIVSNYEVRHDRASGGSAAGSNTWPTKQACLGTAAAPTYFAPVVMDGVVHVDGGLNANNPCLHALYEASSIWPGRPVGCVLSLGTGKVSAGMNNTSSGVLYWAGQLASIATNSYRSHQEVIRFLNQYQHAPSSPYASTSYFRFDPAGAGDTAMDESSVERLAAMRVLTRDYMEANSAQANQLALRLLQITRADELSADMARLFSSQAKPEEVVAALALLRGGMRGAT